MKKVFLVLPLAIMLANCSSTRNTAGSSAGSGTNATAAGATANADMNTGVSGSTSASASDAASTGTTATAGVSGSGAVGSSNAGSSNTSASANASTSATTNSSANASGNWNNNSVATASTSANWNNGSTASTTPGKINWDVYDPNNYMQNPEKYRKPYEMGKTGGWTYVKDWRRNTNFSADAVGEWQLVLTPEVAAHWMPDTRRPETYASFWTPEAVMARYQATMAAAARAQDSIAALNASTASINGTTTGRRGSKSSLTNRRNGTTAGMTASAGASGASWSGSGTTGTVGTAGSASVTGSGTTGSMGAGGTSSGSSDMSASTTNATGMNNNVNVPFSLKAVNGNNFMLPSLNLFIDNGSFTAYTGCNNAVGTIVVNGTSLRFEEANPSANVECIGGFEQTAFLDRLRRADSYDVVNNQFRLKQGDQVLMVFAKNAQ